MLVGELDSGRDVGLGGDDDDDAVLRVLALEVLVCVVREVGAVGGDDEGGLGEGWGEVGVEVDGRVPGGRGVAVAGGGGGGEEGEEEGEERLEVHFDGGTSGLTGPRSVAVTVATSMKGMGGAEAQIPFPTPWTSSFRCYAMLRDADLALPALQRQSNASSRGCRRIRVSHVFQRNPGISTGFGNCLFLAVWLSIFCLSGIGYRRYEPLLRLYSARGRRSSWDAVLLEDVAWRG